jgi:uncharacterized repeat protein (TIGR03833 family)
MLSYFQNQDQFFNEKRVEILRTYINLFHPVLFALNSGVITVMNAINRVKIKPGQCVLIVLKKDQRSGKLTEGIVKDILTKSPTHPHGIKVRLESGEIGRVKEVLE